MEEAQRERIQLEREQVVSLVRRFGGATSDAVLDPAMNYFTCPGVEGVIGYRIAYRCAVVFGDPICALEDRSRLAFAFHRFAKENKLSIVYIAASQSFAHWAQYNVCQTLLEFGREIVYDPFIDPKAHTGPNGSLVRRKVKRAIKEGVEIAEFFLSDPSLRKEMEEVGVKWLQSRRGPQIHISNVYLFQDCEGKRWFYATCQGKIVGTISLNQLKTRQGWLINHLMCLPEAPIGTSELLFTAVLDALKQEGCRFVTVGVITGKQLGQIEGLGMIASWLARNVFKMARKIYDLDGLHTFWGKFHPEKEPLYLLFSNKGIGLFELMSISRATNGPL